MRTQALSFVLKKNLTFAFAANVEDSAYVILYSITSTKQSLHGESGAYGRALEAMRLNL